jgi:phosphatidylglycerol:prolipoprotein diacylglycerol transferase
MLLAQAIGRWGNFFNQELYGPPTTLPWGITITNVNQRIPPFNDLTLYPLDTTFHPVFLYESLWNLAGFVLLMWTGRKYANKLLDGDILSFYLIWYSAGRIVIEALRPDAWIISNIPAAQIMSVILILIGLGLIYYRRQRPELMTSPETHPTVQPKRRRPARK